MIREAEEPLVRKRNPSQVAFGWMHLSTSEMVSRRIESRLDILVVTVIAHVALGKSILLLD